MELSRSWSCVWVVGSGRGLGLEIVQGVYEGRGDRRLMTRIVVDAASRSWGSGGGEMRVGSRNT